MKKFLSKERDAVGRWAEGNAGGPGRPRRPVEREYLAALSDAVSLETWREIVDKATVDAKNGDGKAREWLTRYLVGETPLSLTALAVRDLLGVTADREIDAEIEPVVSPGMFDLLIEDSHGPGLLRRAFLRGGGAE